MSKANKLERAQQYMDRNNEILAKVEKLCSEYRNNHQSAQNLYKKAQIKDWELPESLKCDGDLHYTFG